MTLATVTTIAIPAFPSLTLGFIVFFLGAELTRHIAFLRNYNIPEPVSGGLVVAAIAWVCFALFNVEISFDLAARDELLVIFFATIGLNARFSDLLRGGRLLGSLLVLTIIFIVVQNSVGTIGAMLYGFPPAVGVLLGSAALIGGHGTAIAWGPTIEAQTGFAAANEIGIATATLGLVVASLLGGPIAKFLIERKRLKSSETDGAIVGLPFRQEKSHRDELRGSIDHINLMRSLLAAHIAVILGYFANEAIAAMGLKLPLFVPCLLVAILLSNTIPYLFPRIQWPARTRALAVVSDFCLSIFLALSLMSMQLWTLSGLGSSILGVLVLQGIVATAFILLVVFRVVGADYQAAVLSAGFAGFALGATPTAIANMSSVTGRYGPAPLAFIILPLISAFFVDLANAFIIRFFVAL
ncbi:MAG: sodium/glutamate symporter [Spirulina sp.]